MIILIRQSKKEILKQNDYMSISVYMNHMLDSDAIDPLVFEKELWGFYLSKSVISDLRKYYIELEKSQKRGCIDKNEYKGKTCHYKAPICYGV